MRMPLPDAALMARKGEIVRALQQLVPGEGVIGEPAGLVPFQSDGLSAYRQPPLAVVLPETTAQVSAVLAWCQANGVKVVPRGAGTSLSGGALPLQDGVVLGMAKFNRIRDIDFDNRVGVGGPGGTIPPAPRAGDQPGSTSRPDPAPRRRAPTAGNGPEH